MNRKFLIPQSEAHRQGAVRAVQIEVFKIGLVGPEKNNGGCMLQTVRSFFSILDGVEAPELGHYDEWIGLAISEKPEEKITALRDEFYRTHRAFARLKKKFG